MLWFIGKMSIIVLRDYRGFWSFLKWISLSSVGRKYSKNYPHHEMKSFLGTMYLCRACRFRPSLSPIWIYERENWHHNSLLASGSTVKHLSIAVYSTLVWALFSFLLRLKCIWDIIRSALSKSSFKLKNNLGVFAIYQADTDFSHKFGKIWTNNVIKEVARQNDW